MQDFFLAYIKEKQLFSRDQKVLLAVSGGLDSVVMAHLFSRSPYSFALAHVNFKLRAGESDADVRFVEALAEELGVPFYTSSLDAAEAAEQEGISIQMAARDLRYQWFSKICQQHGFSCVATAHHLNDQAETMLLNLGRGTGIAGLHGIASRRGNVVRPLLFATRAELEHYAEQHQLLWREDSSNSSLKYRRNKIRKLVMPVLKELNPQVEWAMSEAADKLAAAERLLQHLVEILRPLLLEERDGLIYLQLPLLLQQQEPQYLLGELLAPYGGGWQEAGAILKSWQKPMGTTSGKWFSTPTHRLSLDREHLIISPSSQEAPVQAQLSAHERELQLGSLRLLTSRYAANEYQINTDPAVAALDFEKLQFPLLVRNPQPGDWFQPLGMRGKKKLSDFMIDRKIPVNLKQEVLLVLSGESIVWVAGYRTDERFKLTPQTQQVFEIRLVKP